MKNKTARRTVLCSNDAHPRTQQCDLYSGDRTSQMQLFACDECVLYIWCTVYGMASLWKPEPRSWHCNGQTVLRRIQETTENKINTTILKKPISVGRVPSNLYAPFRFSAVIPKLEIWRLETLNDFIVNSLFFIIVGLLLVSCRDKGSEKKVFRWTLISSHLSSQTLETLIKLNFCD